MSFSEPKLEQRPAQPYVGITKTVSVQQLSTDLPPLSEAIFQWMTKNGIELVGLGFWRYITINMPASLQIEVGVPVAKTLAGEGHIKGGTLPAGKYAVMNHHGNPRELEEATRQLLEWAKKNNVTWDTSTNANGEQVWTARVEWYHSDLKAEPNMDNWDNELAFLTTK